MRVRDPKNEYVESYVNGSHIVALCIGDQGTKEMLRVVGSRVWRNNSQQHATTCNTVYKRTQHATPEDILRIVGQQCATVCK